MPEQLAARAERRARSARRRSTPSPSKITVIALLRHSRCHRAVEAHSGPGLASAGSPSMFADWKRGDLPNEDAEMRGLVAHLEAYPRIHHAGIGGRQHLIGGQLRTRRLRVPVDVTPSKPLHSITSHPLSARVPLIDGEDSTRRWFHTTLADDGQRLARSPAMRADRFPLRQRGFTLKHPLPRTRTVMTLRTNAATRPDQEN